MMLNVLRKLREISSQFWFLVAFLIIVFTFGGSSRLDVQSLAVLRPVSFAFLAVGLVTLRLEQIKANALLVFGICATMALALVHLIPLPAEFSWSTSVGTIDDVIMTLTEVEKQWQPFTATPSAGWQAVLALVLPCVVIILGIQLDKKEICRLLPLLIVLICLSGLLGLTQIVSDPNGPLYPYQISNRGHAVGLFANRNHAATVLACLFPMLAVYAAQREADGAGTNNRKKIYCGVIAAVLVPLILVTGSRSGLVIAGFGLVGAALLYQSPFDQPTKSKVERRAKSHREILFLGFLVVVLAIITVVFARAAAFERLIGSGQGESRVEFLVVSVKIFWANVPWGAGSGSYVETYKLAEPGHLLDATYLNRAHNDWVEIAVNFGAPGIVLLTIAAFGFIWRSYRLWRRQYQPTRMLKFGRMASISIFMIVTASVSDYPLRTPIIITIMAVLALYLMGRQQASAETASGDRACLQG